MRREGVYKRYLDIRDKSKWIEKKKEADSNDSLYELTVEIMFYLKMNTFVNIHTRCHDSFCLSLLLLLCFFTNSSKFFSNSILSDDGRHDLPTIVVEHIPHNEVWHIEINLHQHFIRSRCLPS